MSGPGSSGSDSLGTRKFFEMTGRFTAREWEDARCRSFLEPRDGKPDTSRTMEQAACPLCFAESRQPLFVKDGWPHWRCQACGGIYVSPCLTQAALDTDVYGESPYPFAEVVTSDSQVRFDSARFSDALDRLEALSPVRSVLDIGCGGGLFLDLARSRGWEIFGTDPLQAYRRLAVARLGDEFVAAQTAEALDAGTRRFGAVTLWEVLDHVADPSATLAAARRWLLPGGVILIFVRNSESLAVRVLRERCNVFLGYAHLTFWSPRSVERFANRHELRVLETRSLISELGPVNNFLAFEDPYRGDAAPVLPRVTPTAIEDAMLGYKILAILGNA